MEEWRKNIKPLSLKGQIAVPYSWWVGDVGSRFLLSLREERKITGSRCPRCKTVFVPPRKNCGRCFIDIDEWVDVGSEGTVVAHTIVNFAFDVQPASTPFAYVLIKLKGADTAFLHIIKKHLGALKNGVPVRAVFRENRTGSIMDIDSFEITEGGSI